MCTEKTIRRELNYLQNDNELLDNKQKELQGTINRLLQSKESFVKAYEQLGLLLGSHCLNFGSFYLALIFPCICHLRINQGRLTKCQIVVNILTVLVGVTCAIVGTYSAIADIMEKKA